MPNIVYNNVVGNRLIDNGRTCEDVTSWGLPQFEHPTTSVEVAGMSMAVDVPDTTRLNAAEYTVIHNNGLNCKYLAEPGKHLTEGRVVRQKYNVPAGENQYESVKYRLIGMHKSTEKGNVERGNPLGSTEKYSLLRYEEEIDGEVTTLIDAMAGIIRYNGKDYTSVVENMLN